jgi:hypothetical protein
MEAPVTQNPSADKFGPPPEQLKRERDDELLKKGARAAHTFGNVALVVAVFVLKMVSHTNRGRISLAAAALGFGGYLLEWYLTNQRRQAEGTDNPYTPPTSITR